MKNGVSLKFRHKKSGSSWQSVVQIIILNAYPVKTANNTEINKETAHKYLFFLNSLPRPHSLMLEKGLGDELD